MNILIMGGPGAGKGTMSAKIVEKFNVNHFPREISSAVKSEREQLLAWRRKASWIKDCWFPTKSLTIW